MNSWPVGKAVGFSFLVLFCVCKSAEWPPGSQPTGDFHELTSIHFGEARERDEKYRFVPLVSLYIYTHISLRY